MEFIWGCMRVVWGCICYVALNGGCVGLRELFGCVGLWRGCLVVVCGCMGLYGVV